MADSLVLDASAALRVLLPSQPGHAEARDVYARILEAGWRVAAPELFAYEAGNVLARSVGRPQERADAFEAVVGLVDLVRPQPATLLQALRHAADKKISFYDAAYAALAQELDAPLWTEDHELRRAFPKLAFDAAELAARLRR